MTHSLRQQGTIIPSYRSNAKKSLINGRLSQMMQQRKPKTKSRLKSSPLILRSTKLNAWYKSFFAI